MAVPTTRPKPTQREPIGWRPMLKGKIYCSPSCGARCTLAAYNRAHKEAEICKSKLLGSGWTIEVWENMGWFWKVSRGVLEIRSFEPSLYTVSVHFCGETYIYRSRDPKRAIRRVLPPARRRLAEIQATYATMLGGIHV